MITKLFGIIELKLKIILCLISLVEEKIKFIKKTDIMLGFFSFSNKAS